MDIRISSITAPCHHLSAYAEGIFKMFKLGSREAAAGGPRGGKLGGGPWGQNPEAETGSTVGPGSQGSTFCK